LLKKTEKNVVNAEQIADNSHSQELDEDAESDDEDDEQERNSDSEEEGSGDLTLPLWYVDYFHETIVTSIRSDWLDYFGQLLLI
jgi:hypothetical protein